jgi:4-hydroxyphenylpyruvate dioxygenase
MDKETLERAKDHAAMDPFPIKGFSHLEWYVGNAYQTAHFLRTALGFSVIGYRGPETGVRDVVSYLCASDQIRFVVSGALHPDHPISEHVKEHGPGVHDVAFAVPDAAAAYEMALSRGAESAYEPMILETERGKAQMAGIKAYGETIHSLVTLDGELPDFEPRIDDLAKWTGLKFIDHVVANVDWGQMNSWVDYYARIFGFTMLRHFDDEDISTEYSALMSKVVWDGTGIIKLPINEPAEGKKKSQIQEYVEFYRGAGVQHIAMATDSVLDTVEQLQDNGLEVLAVPSTYYDDLKKRMPNLDVDWDRLQKLKVLADEDEGGQLLQLFSKMLQDRPTVFFEFIERRGATGFGEGNFKALFEAIEREQDLRGNL